VPLAVWRLRLLLSACKRFCPTLAKPGNCAARFVRAFKGEGFA
jgi:hypothetical protein